jgi:hypothetical protein
MIRSTREQISSMTRGELEELWNALLEPLFPVARGIRLLGISMSSLSAEEAEQPKFSLPVKPQYPDPVIQLVRTP